MIWAIVQTLQKKVTYGIILGRTIAHVDLSRFEGYTGRKY